ncbi:hypothetical protein [Tritonibacter mobilis]|uniref:hypothetical protein n=1 Tax=Tritonibacter mobilis TaxID=379347 RepID=UPI0008069C92|nr:hypothetical protein [Tritonibacter mobilis]GLP85145.1 hypothetical protein GCM10007921_07050 [Tritonibacter mobilis]SDW83476.1 hypothetical protein SAMN05444385_103500 [Tritonibacter mobilis]
MPTKTVSLALGAFLLTATSALAREPLAAIDWLNTAPPVANIPPTLLQEPPVAQSAHGPDITVTPLERLLPPVGLVPEARTGLPITLWQGSPADQLAALIRDVPVYDLPAMQSLLMTLLLTEARPPFRDDDQILLARLDRLRELGATEPVQALVQEAGPTQSPARFDRWFDATLLNGDEERSCAALTADPYLMQDYSARIFCAARRGDWPTAALMLETADALSLIGKQDMAILDRFLNPDIYEGMPPLPLPASPTPLEFRMFEAIGEPMPTTMLPRAFASADLRDIAGWKAQLEGAERLTRSRAMNPNQLLGLFTDRKPAASGGIWDRVEAVQRFDTALNTQSAEAVRKTLPAFWSAAQAAGLEMAMADLFAPRLAKIKLDGKAAVIAWRLRLLSSEYESAAATPPDQTRQSRFLATLAKGEPASDLAASPQEKAIVRGFAQESEMPAAQKLLLDQGRLGEAILVTMKSFSHGADGNLEAAALSLAAFRLMGLEDIARRAALQLLLLPRGS